MHNTMENEEIETEQLRKEGAIKIEGRNGCNETQNHWLTTEGQLACRLTGTLIAGYLSSIDSGAAPTLIKKQIVHFFGMAQDIIEYADTEY